MRNMTKRISFLLVLVMVFAMMAMPAAAVSVEGSKAIVSDAEVDAAILAAKGDTVTLTCMEMAMVSSVEISAKSLAKIAETGKSLSVVTMFASVEINGAAMQNVAAQIGTEGVVSLVVEINPKDKLNDAQLAALKQQPYMMVLNTDMLYDGKSVDIGEGGYMVAKLPAAMVGDMAEQYVVAHLDEDGTIDVVETDFVNGSLQAKLEKLAIYILMPKAEEKPVNPFVDVAESDWFYAPVMWAVENGVTGGKTADTFAPYDFCTRAQVVTFLYAAAGKPAVEVTENPFEDVSESDWFYAPVMWAVANGITGGVDATHFAPNNICTRAQVVTFLYAAAGKPAFAGQAPNFADVTENDWFAKPVMWAAENGITSGMGDGTFGAGNNCTRAQVVTFLKAASK